MRQFRNDAEKHAYLVEKTGITSVRADDGSQLAIGEFRDDTGSVYAYIDMFVAVMMALENIDHELNPEYYA